MGYAPGCPGCSMQQKLNFGGFSPFNDAAHYHSYCTINDWGNQHEVKCTFDSKTLHHTHVHKDTPSYPYTQRHFIIPLPSKTLYHAPAHKALHHTPTSKDTPTHLTPKTLHRTPAPEDTPSYNYTQRHSIIPLHARAHIGSHPL